MLSSMELRWFFEGDASESVRAWFFGPWPGPEVAPTRVDRYLHFADGASNGTKLREGKLEIKLRVQDHGIWHIRENVAGVLEYWRKWSFRVPEDDHEVAGIERGDGAWIPVQKERALRKFTVADDRSVAPVELPLPAGVQPPDQGCNVELTALQVQRQAWWTLGLEAFGDEARLPQNLLLVAEHVFATPPPVPLSPDASYGYPEWLRRLHR